MDLKQLWLNTQDRWGALDQHPLVHTSLTLGCTALRSWLASDGVITATTASPASRLLRIWVDHNINVHPQPL